MKYLLYSIIIIFVLSEVGCTPKETKTPMSKVDSLSHVLSGDSLHFECIFALTPPPIPIDSIFTYQLKNLQSPLHFERSKIFFTKWNAFYEVGKSQKEN